MRIVPAIFAVVVLCLPVYAVQQQSSNAVGHSVSEFTKSDGRFDLDAARKLGIQGSLDLKGFNVSLDPQSGAPVIKPASAATSSDPDDVCWQKGFNLQGLDGPVHALTVYNGRLVAGGHFNVACDTTVRNIAAWNGTSWAPLGSGIGGAGYYNGIVRALIIYNGDLIAGGYFDTAGVLPAYNIAAWNGTTWSALGLGTNGGVLALAVYNNKLIAGGDFLVAGGNPANHLASWNGSSWTALGSGTDDDVWVLAVYNNRLYIGGDFTNAGGLAVNHIASYSDPPIVDTTWATLGYGIEQGVPKAMATFNNKLIVGGYFEYAGGQPWARLAAWDGTNWSYVHDMGDWGDVYSMTVFNNKLIVGGVFWISNNGDTLKNIFAWDGVSASSLGSSTPYGFPFYALAIYDDKLVAAGQFNSAGGGGAMNIVNWNGSAWSPLGLGASGYYGMNAFAIYNNQLVIGGDLHSIGDVAANNIAAWDGTTWSTFGSGTDGEVFALEVYNNSLFVGGQFDSAGNQPARAIASWDGSLWHSYVADGIDNTMVPDRDVHAMTVFDNELIVGGQFQTYAGGCFNIVALDETGWHDLGTGLTYHDSSPYIPAHVLSLTVYNSMLIAGGRFDRAGYDSNWSEIVAYYIAAWNGSTWSPLGGVNGGASGPVNALTVYDNKLILGGEFSYGGGGGSTVPMYFIGAYDGSSYSSLGSGMAGGHVDALTVYDNRLIAGGEFTSAGGEAANGVAAWNGSTWSRLGSGANYPTVKALIEFNGKLTVGGSFTIAGVKASAFIAQWYKPAEDEDGDNVPDIYDNCLHVANPGQEDFDADGVGDVCDNCPTIANTDQADGNADGIGDACTYGTPTPTGNNVQVPVGSQGNLEFASVTQAGTSDMTISSSGPASSSSFQIFPAMTPVYYNITTTATFSGSIKVCLNYDSFGLTPLQEQTIRLYHYADSKWVDITSSRDTAANIVCGLTTTLSPFVIAMPNFICGDANGDGSINVGDAVFLIGYVFRGGQAPNPIEAGDANCDGMTNVGDAVFIITYVFKGGAKPCCP